MIASSGFATLIPRRRKNTAIRTITAITTPIAPLVRKSVTGERGMAAFPVGLLKNSSELAPTLRCHAG